MLNAMLLSMITDINRLNVFLQNYKKTIIVIVYCIFCNGESMIIVMGRKLYVYGDFRFNLVVNIELRCLFTLYLSLITRLTFLNFIPFVKKILEYEHLTSKLIFKNKWF